MRVCDRCTSPKQVLPVEFYAYSIISADPQLKPRYTADLCEPCCVELETWLKGSES